MQFEIGDDASDEAATQLAELDDQAGVAKGRFVRAGCLARLGRVGECEAELDLALGAARAAGDRRRTVAVLGAAPLAAPGRMAELAMGLFWRIALIAGAIAAIDYIWQRADHARKLRMTHQELKEEQKQAEGDPMLKAQRRRRAEEIATNRMMLDVPKADVIIVNPTHYAVALQWRRGVDAAPKVTAKGVDGVAFRIRETAERAGVPVHSDPPTARALEATTEIGAEIAPAHYQAVAAAIRFAEAMREKARARGP